MLKYYSANVLMCCGALLILILLVHENARLSKDEKKQLYSICCVLIIAELAELGSTLLIDAPPKYAFLHALMIATDYSTTPVTAGLLIGLVGKGKKSYGLRIILIINAVIEYASVFTGWIFNVSKDNVAVHGPLYILYMLLYIFIITAAILRFHEYGKDYKKGESYFHRTNRTAYAFRNYSP